MASQSGIMSLSKTTKSFREDDFSLMLSKLPSGPEKVVKKQSETRSRPVFQDDGSVFNLTETDNHTITISKSGVKKTHTKTTTVRPVKSARAIALHRKQALIAGSSGRQVSAPFGGALKSTCDPLRILMLAPNPKNELRLAQEKEYHIRPWQVR